jgi:hypothetical protein
MTRAKSKMSEERGNDNEVLLRVTKGATDLEQLARITGQTEDDLAAAIHRINAESMQHNGVLQPNGV